MAASFIRSIRALSSQARSTSCTRCDRTHKSGKVAQVQGIELGATESTHRYVPPVPLCESSIALSLLYHAGQETALVHPAQRAGFYTCAGQDSSVNSADAAGHTVLRILHGRQAQHLRSSGVVP